jgi:hypothetical protein
VFEGGGGKLDGRLFLFVFQFFFPLHGEEAALCACNGEQQHHAK